jgi:hypothetical protein
VWQDFAWLWLIRGESAHIWLEIDTACRMWSTKGIRNANKWHVRNDPDRAGKSVCAMCQAVIVREMLLADAQTMSDRASQ